MLKQILFIALAITTIKSTCATSEDQMCRSCISVCLACDEGYLSGSLLTTVCKAPTTETDNCATYKSATECSECDYGYYLKDKKCMEISTTNCATADSNGVCETCKDGKTYDSTKKECTDTDCTTANCNMCMSVLTNEVCGWCKSGYALTTSGLKQVCESDSAHCAKKVGTNCTVCHSGYFMKGSTCMEVTNSIQRLVFMIFFAFLLL